MATAAELDASMCPAYIDMPSRCFLAPRAWQMELLCQPLPCPLTPAPERCGARIRHGIGDRAEASTSGRAVRRDRGKQNSL
eukprot:2430461-Pyramimonas_sp.AAC.1